MGMGNPYDLGKDDLNHSKEAAISAAEGKISHLINVLIGQIQDAGWLRQCVGTHNVADECAADVMKKIQRQLG